MRLDDDRTNRDGLDDRREQDTEERTWDLSSTKQRLSGGGDVATIPVRCIGTSIGQKLYQETEDTMVGLHDEKKIV